MYKLIPLTPGSFEKALRVSDTTFINLEVESLERSEYLKWLDEGNTPLPADTQPE